ncbi:MAG: helix-turn-helix domain-containing protein [Alphaproteobacteria bacterium]|nr:helix-turn-helix domain-containing protein [Alphaproteobacteria bacterium SS10]
MTGYLLTETTATSPPPQARRMPEFLSVKRVARLLDVHPQTVRRMLDNGTLDGIRLGRVRLVSVQSYLEYVEKQKCQSRQSEAANLSPLALSSDPTSQTSTSEMVAENLQLNARIGRALNNA